jgi:hypothetical protein
MIRLQKIGRYDKLDSGEALEMRREFGSGKAVWERSEASILSNVVIARRPKYAREHKKQGASTVRDLRSSKMQSVSYRMGVLAAVERLRNQHGEAGAHKLAVLEQQKARRARCRKRFHFWWTVAGQIGNELARDAQ